MQISEAEIYSIERPARQLLWLYIVRSILTGPGIIVVLPLLIFRYETLRYRFDAEGIHMRWGFLFRKQVNLTYARIQDIHINSGLIQRWFGLADIQVQTASGSAGAEMTIEGLLAYEAIRDFLYTRMRGYRDSAARPAASAQAAAPGAAPHFAATDAEVATLLCATIDELRGARLALERLHPGSQQQGG